MRPVVDHFRKTPSGQKKCAPQPAVELCLAGARRILPILAPRPTALAVAPARLRGRQRFPRTVAHRSSQISRRADPLSQVRRPRDVPDIPRSRCRDFRTFYRASQIRRSLRGRPIWERGRSETSILGRPALTPGFKPAFGRNPTRSCRQQLRGTRLRTVIPLPPPREIRTVMPMSRNPNSRISRELSGDAPSLPGPARNRPTFGQTAG